MVKGSSHGKCTHPQYLRIEVWVKRQMQGGCWSVQQRSTHPHACAVAGPHWAHGSIPRLSCRGQWRPPGSVRALQAQGLEEVCTSACSWACAPASVCFVLMPRQSHLAWTSVPNLSAVVFCWQKWAREGAEGGGRGVSTRACTEQVCTFARPTLLAPSNQKKQCVWEKQGWQVRAWSRGCACT